jgi:hypothetical protein
MIAQGIRAHAKVPQTHDIFLGWNSIQRPHEDAVYLSATDGDAAADVP